MVGVELVTLGMHFDNCGSLCAPVPDIIVSIGIYVEFLQEGLDIMLVVDCQKFRSEVLSEGHLLVAVFLNWWVRAFPTD